MKAYLIRNKSFQLAILNFVIIVSSSVLYHFDPADSKIYPPSLSRQWGGFYCAGCGVLRGLHQLLHGNWLSAFKLNPLLVVIFPYLIYWFLAYNLRVYFNLRLPLITWGIKQIKYFSIVVLLYALMRNIPLNSFFWLRPH